MTARGRLPVRRVHAAHSRGRGGRDGDLRAEPAGLGRVPAAVHHVPVERCAGVIAALTGTRPSDGCVHGMLARAAEAVRGVTC